MTIAQGELILASDMPCVVRATFNGTDADLDSYYDSNHYITVYEIPYSSLTFQSGSINLLTQCNQIFIYNQGIDYRYGMIAYIDTLSGIYVDSYNNYFRRLYPNNSISINVSATKITIPIIQPLQGSYTLSSWQGAFGYDTPIPYILFGYKI